VTNAYSRSSSITQSFDVVVCVSYPHADAVSDGYADANLDPDSDAQPYGYTDSSAGD
jgi:hypothetical protein